MATPHRLRLVMAFEPGQPPTVGAFPMLDLVNEQPEFALHRAVALSLFTWRRAEDDDNLLGVEPDRKGWWADTYRDDADQYGSRLWLLVNETTTAGMERAAEEYAREALEWMVEDGVVGRVDVTPSISRPGGTAVQVELEITLTQPDPVTTPIAARYMDLWEAMQNA